MKLTQQELKEIVRNMDKGKSVQFRNSSLKEYQSYIKQINNYLIQIGKKQDPFFL